MKLFTLFFVCMGPLAFALEAPEFAAKSVALYHPKTQSFVVQHNANARMAPASLTKMMTLYVAFNALKSGELTLESELPISEKAWKKGGSKMFLEVGKTAKVRDLIRGIAVSSGNDATIVLSEYLAGSEEAFARRMNTTARKIGLRGTSFANASGWPHPQQFSTARDMAILAARLQQDHPKLYGVFSERSFTYSDITQKNRNGLLGLDPRIDGLKTGHVEEAGFHLAGSGISKGDRLIAIAMGAEDFHGREQAALTALRFGWGNFKTRTLWQQGKIVAEAPVWLGKTPRVKIAVAETQTHYAPKEGDYTKAEADIETPLKAPLKAGQQVGVVRYQLTGVGNDAGKTIETPLVVAEDVAKAPLLARWVQKFFWLIGVEQFEKV